MKINIDAKSFVVLTGQGPVWNIAPGRSANPKLQRNRRGMVMLEEVAPTRRAHLCRLARVAGRSRAYPSSRQAACRPAAPCQLRQQASVEDVDYRAPRSLDR